MPLARAPAASVTAMPASSTSFLESRPDAAKPETVSVVTSAPPNAAAVSSETPSAPPPALAAERQRAPLHAEQLGEPFRELRCRERTLEAQFAVRDSRDPNPCGV